MPKILFNISDTFMKQVTESIKRWGFESRAEFFRFAAVEFIRNDALKKPADDVLEDLTKAIRSVEARVSLTEKRKRWNRWDKIRD